MQGTQRMTTEEARTAMLARPEFQKEAVVRAAVRWCRIASEEGLTPFEAAVAWQRMANTMLREARWKVATADLIGTLATEVAAAMAGVEAKTMGREAVNRPTENTENTEGGAA